MSILKKTPTPLSLAERATEAANRGVAALSAFEQAARDLEIAASELEDLATEAQDEADRLIEEALAQAKSLRALADGLDGTAASQLAQAGKIRELVGA